ncbi:MAG: transglutaminase-like domain-containing protein [Myxococcota bacterium]
MVKPSLILTFGLLVPTVAGAAPPTVVGHVQITRPDNLALANARAIWIPSSTPEALIEQLGPHWARREGAAVFVELEKERPRPEATLPEAYLASTFVVDHAEPAIAQRVVELKAKHGDLPKVADIESFVASFVEPNYKSLFSVASTVAREGSGDCTEYAVLLCALLRATGRPARVVIGVLIADLSEAMIAQNHAWVEYWREGAWHPLDASPLAARSEITTLALPFGRISNEGPSWRIGMMSIYEALPGQLELRGAP